MSVLQDVTTAVQSSSRASSIVSIAQARRHARGTLVNRAAEQERSQLRGIWQVVGLWLRRGNDRAMLRSFSERDIHDFCPKGTEAEAEMNKPFWRA